MPNPSSDRAIAIVGLGAILPDALNAPAFWQNIIHKRYCITETPPDRWSIADYYDPDPTAPDKTYSKIGGWVRGYQFDWKRYRIPPKVAAAMDEGQQWAVSIADEALSDYGYPNRPLDTERTGVILGTAMGGELHYITQQRVAFPEFMHALEAAPEFAALPAAKREAILRQWHQRLDATLPPITEDSMPGELPNIVAGRVANIFNLRGPNFITDAACASSFAAIDAAFELLVERHVDAVITGGVDRNMGPVVFVKFCKIGALSATGSRPFGEGADGFVMGEGSAAFLLKRLSDAERDGDKIYAVIRGVGASSDGKGKGITAPNPQGQVLSAVRAWENAGLDPATATLVEAHGTSTRVGDVVEVESLTKVFGGAPRGSIGLGSAKSNIGHLKAGAGAAGLLKATMAIYHKVLPPTLNARTPNPNIDFASTPFFLIHEPMAWEQPKNFPRRAGVSAYGFGGTNFHIVLEEYVPGMLKPEPKIFAAAKANGEQQRVEASTLSHSASPSAQAAAQPTTGHSMHKKPLRGILSIGAHTPTELKDKLDDIFRRVEAGWTPERELPPKADLAAPERLFIDFGTHEELLDRIQKARKAAGFDNVQAWKALQGQGIFRGGGPKPGKLGYLFPGQGSQYVNMGRLLAEREPVVAQVFKEADEVMTPILGRPLTSYIFVDSSDPQAVKQAELALMQTAITQPAMLTMDTALYRLLAEYGFEPDMVMGHSLGEYAALIAAGVMPFAHALEAAAARGAEMTRVSVEDNGWMAAVMAPLPVIEETLREVDGYVVAANINSYNQCVVGGASKAVEQAIQRFEKKGYRAVRIPVSHAFHTRIVAPASKPLRKVLDRLSISSPRIPLVANVTGELYPTGVEEIKDILERQIASPVQWVKGLETMHREGVRCFVEVGPKRALKGFVDDVLGDQPDVWSLLTNHPKTGELESFNQALCGLYAAGYGAVVRAAGGEGRVEPAPVVVTTSAPVQATMKESAPMPQSTVDSNNALGQALMQALQQLATGAASFAPRPSPSNYDRNETPAGSVVITGTGLGLPGANKSVMDPENALRILRGEQFVDLIPERFRKEMANKRITRLVKGEDGSGHFEVIEDTDEVIKLAGRGGYFNLAEEYGVPEKLIEALDITTQLAMAAGLDALREAGIPLVQTYRPTSKGTYLPDRWLLPEALRDETGVIFASAFPGGDRMAEEFRRYYEWENRRRQLAMLEDLRQYASDPTTLREIMRRIGELRNELERHPYEFDRRFIFRILAMGHSQFAEYIGARGPNTHVNAACASTAQAIALAEDWIRDGRCRRVIVIGADDVTSENLMGWVGAGFLATGAAATDDKVDEAALPFDRRRHGTLLGMGACALVIESEDAVRERGMRGIAELLSSETANSAYHGTRLDVSHISDVMNRLVTAAERRFGLNRYVMAPQMAFISHETFTPARGGSASAEVMALRNTFAEAANEIVVCNTKGFTGHPMGAGVEDVIAVKILEYGIVPPVPNFKEVDPELGVLNLSRGGRYPVQYALHLSAGFGSQIAMTLLRRIPGGHDRIDDKARYQRWLDDVSGYDHARTEVVKRVLRIAAQGQPVRSPAPSAWRYGTGPTLRAAAPGDGLINEYRPLPMPAVAAAVRGEALGRAEERAARGDGAAPVVSAPSKPAPPAPSKPAPPPPASEPAPQVPTLQTAEPAAPSIAAPSPAPVVQPEPIVAPVAQQPVQAPSADPVVDQVLEVVAAKTGYPQDMLDLDLDLEADLGIDTVKQAETFAAIREAFGIPFQEGLNLRDYPTLQSVIDFVRKMRPDLGEAKAEEGGAREEVAPSPPPQSAEAPPSASDPVVTKVLAVVAEKTGYPPEMLELDLDLEADLGIDTVKQAETFASIREAFGIPFQEGLNLRDYPTLQSVIDFVRKMRPDLGEAKVEVQEAPSETQSPQAVASPSPIQTIGALEDADRIPRRVPVPVLRPPIDFCKPTGVTIGADSRIVVMLDRGGVGQKLVEKLQKRGATVLTLEPGVATDALDSQLKTWLSEGKIQGVFWLPALDVEPPIEEMTAEEWREHNRVRVKNLYTTMRALYDSVSGPNTFLVSATRLGGLHGYGPVPAVAPLGGAVVGFTKAYNMEQALREGGKGVTVKAVDFEASRKTVEPAEQLIAEALFDPGVVEVGYFEGQRYTVSLEEQPARDGAPGMALGKDTVFVVTGAAGGITSAITVDLAAHSGGVFYLLDLVQAPARDDKYVTLFRQGRETLKQALIAEAKAAGEKATPKQIDDRILAIERQEAALRAIEAVEAAGGTAHYYSLDLRDGDKVAAVVEEIRQRHGKIDVLLHAGGLLLDRTLPNKEPNQFALVYDVKADGFFNLLKAARGMPIGATVSFSSVAGRFGNNGQTDYSAANDLLCKITSSMRTWRPQTRGIAIDWTAWGQIGMASRGSVQQILESLGVDMLPPEAGVPTIRRELTYGGARGEVVVAGRLGAWLDEKDPTGGLDVDKLNAWLAARERPLLMVGAVKSYRLYGGLEVETTLDPKVQPFLFDHAPDEGTPWLPGVMATEALAQTATVAAPGYRVASVEHEEMLGAFKFFRMEPRTLHLSATVKPAGGGELLARVTLRSVTKPAKEGLPVQVKEHFIADVRLTTAPAEKPTLPFTPPAAESLPITAQEIYKTFFHGPAYQVIERAGVDGEKCIALMAHSLPADAEPAHAASLMAPRLVELCFQAAALWHTQVKQAMAFPLGFEKVIAYRQPEEAEGRRLYCIGATPNDGERFDATVVDEAGNVFVALTGYRTVGRPT